MKHDAGQVTGSAQILLPLNYIRLIKEEFTGKDISKWIKWTYQENISFKTA